MTCGLATALEPPHFNPRTRVGCDQSLVLYHRAAREFQSTHPREVRPCDITGGDAATGVSIHAPAWGATRLSDKWVTGMMGFNPRTRVGCDASLLVYVLRPRFVSIHAPAWGATAFCHRSVMDLECFNPRTRVGCDTRYRPSLRVSDLFQSTHPRGVRQRVTKSIVIGQ